MWSDFLIFGKKTKLWTFGSVLPITQYREVIGMQTTGLANKTEEEEAAALPNGQVVALHQDGEGRRVIDVPATEELQGHSPPTCPDPRGLSGCREGSAPLPRGEPCP